MKILKINLKKEKDSFKTTIKIFIINSKVHKSRKKEKKRKYLFLNAHTRVLDFNSVK